MTWKTKFASLLCHFFYRLDDTFSLEQALRAAILKIYVCDSVLSHLPSGNSYIKHSNLYGYFVNDKKAKIFGDTCYHSNCQVDLEQRDYRYLKI